MEIIALYDPLLLDDFSPRFDPASGDQPTVRDSREICAVCPDLALTFTNLAPGQAIRQRPMEMNPGLELQTTVFEGTCEEFFTEVGDIVVDFLFAIPIGN